MSYSAVPITHSLCTFVTHYRRSHTTIVTGKHPQGIKVFTDNSSAMPGIHALSYAHEGIVPGRIVYSVSYERAPKNEEEQLQMDILQASSRIMTVTRIRTSDDSGLGLLITPSLTGAALGCRPVLLTAATVDNSGVAVYLNDFYSACPVLQNEHISDPGWYAPTVNLIGERCTSFI